MTKQPEALRLAEVLDFEYADNGAGYNTEWTRGLQESAAELRRLHQQELALITWLEKTDWLQAAAQPGELGLHRADAIKKRFDRLHVANHGLMKALDEIVAHIQNHPAYDELTEEEEVAIGGDTAELSYLARICERAIREALTEQPAQQQEPVAICEYCEKERPVYTSPPASKPEEK